MARGQVGARTEGDYDQGLFFWREAALLLRDDELVKEVILEGHPGNGEVARR